MLGRENGAVVVGGCERLSGREGIEIPLLPRPMPSNTISVSSLHMLLEIHEQQEAPFRTARDCERHGLRRLRFLREVEPIRKIFVAVGPHAKHLPPGALLLMDSYMRSLLDALLALHIDTSNRCAADDEAIAEVRIRLDKMTGAVIEAVREISRQHFKEKELAYLCGVVKCVDVLV